MCQYIDFPLDNTAIAVESASYHTNILIPDHMHAFHEFVLITRGACMHSFRDIEIPLLAGDVFMIPPHQKHSYRMNAETGFINCYFYPNQLGDDWHLLMEETLPTTSVEDNLEDVRSQWESLLIGIVPDTDEPEKEESCDKAQMQGIIHLNSQETLRVEALLNQIGEEQESHQFGTEYVKAALLQVILVTIKRAQDRQNPKKKRTKKSSRKRELIAGALNTIDEHYNEKLDTAALARECALSESYFRMLFKEVTGLTPLEYTTRVRVIRSLEFLERDDVPVNKAAEMVGIYDPNYFTRVFKKVMGYPPIYFKKIET